jgi:hypothetical protein
MRHNPRGSGPLPGGPTACVAAGKRAEPASSPRAQRRASGPVLAVGAVLLAGCAVQQPQDWNVAALSSLRPAQSCQASLPFFGHWHYIGEEAVPPGYMPPDGRIRMDNDGGWCTLSNRFTWEYIPMTPLMTMAQPPQHGDVVLGATGGSLRIAYRPAPGYAGPDSFQVHLDAPSPETIPVQVVVTR